MPSLFFYRHFCLILILSVVSSERASSQSQQLVKTNSITTTTYNSTQILLNSTTIVESNSNVTQLKPSNITIRTLLLILNATENATLAGYDFENDTSTTQNFSTASLHFVTKNRTLIENDTADLLNREHQIFNELTTTITLTTPQSPEVVFNGSKTTGSSQSSGSNRSRENAIDTNVTTNFHNNIASVNSSGVANWTGSAPEAVFSPHQNAINGSVLLLRNSSWVAEAISNNSIPTQPWLASNVSVAVDANVLELLLGNQLFDVNTFNSTWQKLALANNSSLSNNSNLILGISSWLNSTEYFSHLTNVSLNSTNVEMSVTAGALTMAQPSTDLPSPANRAVLNATTALEPSMNMSLSLNSSTVDTKTESFGQLFETTTVRTNLSMNSTTTSASIHPGHGTSGLDFGQEFDMTTTSTSNITANDSVSVITTTNNWFEQAFEQNATVVQVSVNRTKENVTSQDVFHDNVTDEQLGQEFEIVNNGTSTNVTIEPVLVNATTETKANVTDEPLGQVFDTTANKTIQDFIGIQGSVNATAQASTSITKELLEQTFDMAFNGTATNGTVPSKNITQEHFEQEFDVPLNHTKQNEVSEQVFEQMPSGTAKNETVGQVFEHTMNGTKENKTDLLADQAFDLAGNRSISWTVSTPSVLLSNKSANISTMTTLLLLLSTVVSLPIVEATPVPPFVNETNTTMAFNSSGLYQEPNSTATPMPPESETFNVSTSSSMDQVTEQQQITNKTTTVTTSTTAAITTPNSLELINETLSQLFDVSNVSTSTDSFQPVVDANVTFASTQETPVSLNLSSLVTIVSSASETNFSVTTSSLSFSRLSTSVQAVNETIVKSSTQSLNQTFDELATTTSISFQNETTPQPVINSTFSTINQTTRPTLTVLPTLPVLENNSQQPINATIQPILSLESSTTELNATVLVLDVTNGPSLNQTFSNATASTNTADTSPTTTSTAVPTTSNTTASSNITTVTTTASSTTTATTPTTATTATTATTTATTTASTTLSTAPLTTTVIPGLLDSANWVLTEFIVPATVPLDAAFNSQLEITLSSFYSQLFAKQPQNNRRRRYAETNGVGVSVLNSTRKGQTESVGVTYSVSRNGALLPATEVESAVSQQPHALQELALATGYKVSLSPTTFESKTDPIISWPWWLIVLVILGGLLILIAICCTFGTVLAKFKSRAKKQEQQLQTPKTPTQAVSKNGTVSSSTVVSTSPTSSANNVKANLIKNKPPSAAASPQRLTTNRPKSSRSVREHRDPSGDEQGSIVSTEPRSRPHSRRSEKHDRTLPPLQAPGRQKTTAGFDRMDPDVARERIRDLLDDLVTVLYPHAPKKRSNINQVEPSPVPHRRPHGLATPMNKTSPLAEPSKKLNHVHKNDMEMSRRKTEHSVTSPTRSSKYELLNPDKEPVYTVHTDGPMHTPMQIFDNPIKPNYGLWNPYRAGDESARIMNLQQGPVVTTPPEPIVLLTKNEQYNTQIVNVPPKERLYSAGAAFDGRNGDRYTSAHFDSAMFLARPHFAQPRLSPAPVAQPRSATELRTRSGPGVGFRSRQNSFKVAPDTGFHAPPLPGNRPRPARHFLAPNNNVAQAT